MQERGGGARLCEGGGAQEPVAAQPGGAGPDFLKFVCYIYLFIYYFC